MKYFIVLAVLILSSNVAFGHGASEGAASVGKDKAVTEADEHEGFKLSEKASKNLDLKFLSLTLALKPSVFSLPPQAIVQMQDEVGVYVRKSGWIKRIEGKLLQKNKDQVLFQSKDLSVGSEVAVSGVPLLRVTEMEVFGSSHEEEEEEDEHEHGHEGEDHHD
ncbi:MAG: hypothetical protein AB7F43_08570 [Bacteriovoracia bacterium]